MWRSVPHREAACTRTSTSPSPGSGRGTSTSSAPGPARVLRRARMVAAMAPAYRPDGGSRSAPPKTSSGTPVGGRCEQDATPTIPRRTTSMHRTRLCAAILALAVASGACARGTVSGRSGGLEHPAGGSLVLRVETGGGFIAPQSTLGQVPEFSLFGDGRIITPGAQPAIYPGPALPNLLVQQVNEDGIQAILEGAREAGLLGPDARYDAPCISDQATTTFTVVADARTHVVSAYALGNDSCNGQDAGARARLATFRARLGDLASWLPRGSIGQQSAYEPTEMRIYVQPLVPSAGQTLEQQPIDWPLA